MFDIGFWEMALIGVVALLVIGPERLPRVARTAGLWIGKGRRFLASVKGEVDRELKAEELKRIMAEQAKSTGLYEITEDTREALSRTDDLIGNPPPPLDTSRSTPAPTPPPAPTATPASTPSSTQAPTAVPAQTAAPTPASTASAAQTPATDKVPSDRAAKPGNSG